jgi:hypothetical protein
MRDDHVQLPIKLEHVRAAYETAPVPSLATYGPKTGFFAYPPNMQCTAYLGICGVQEYAGLAIEALRNPQQERRCAPHILGVF